MVESTSCPCLSRLKTGCAAFCLLASPALADTPAKIAVFPFEIRDTSGEPGGPGTADRIARATVLLATALKETGHYAPVDLTTYAKEIAGLQRPDECGECWAAVARTAGATLEVLPSVHKVSTLITLMTLWFADLHTMRYVARVEGQIRGDTDEAYARGIHFLVTEELGEKTGRAVHGSPP